MHAYIHTYVNNSLKTYWRGLKTSSQPGWSYQGIHAYIHTYRQTDRQTDIQTYRQTDRQTDIHTYIHTYRQTDRQTDRQTYLVAYVLAHMCICANERVYVKVGGRERVGEQKGRNLVTVFQSCS